jgi:hypothetical protein
LPLKALRDQAIIFPLFEGPASRDQAIIYLLFEDKLQRFDSSERPEAQFPIIQYIINQKDQASGRPIKGEIPP